MRIPVGNAFLPLQVWRIVESRRRGKQSVDGDKKRKSQISTKPAFVRREENNKKAAIEASRKRKQEEAVEKVDGGDDFAGFDD